MKILLIGEYSNVHWTLAEGLRQLGHTVTVISNGDYWKNYNRDISLTRSYSKAGGLRYITKLIKTLPLMRGYDIVQIINPIFLEIKADLIFPIYRYIRKHNNGLVLCAFGMDYYWVKTCCDSKPLRYSDFNIGDSLRNNADAIKERKDWIGTSKERLNKYIADDCDMIVAGLYEYFVCYRQAFAEKTAYIPFPIKPERNALPCDSRPGNMPLRIFIGINKTRNEYKGTDIMLEAVEDIQRKYKEKVELIKVESVPFGEYVRLMNNSDVLLDQLYSYTPAMNALQAMAKGIICVGGGEPENYDILNEDRLRPIVNVLPEYGSVYDSLERLVLHPEMIPSLKRQSIEYIGKHHDYIKVARQYESLYYKIISERQ
ncbi:glycosyltransferase family 1 protein [Leyella lascolaii]|uniref:glycosyltransferase family 1 protein n=1 Tax=Leyella lascolaii TaxID=1776379 RepID=UPI002352184B|nr:glycosyltransferase family 1 protein [Leyella lascolaii]